MLDYGIQLNTKEHFNICLIPYYEDNLIPIKDIQNMFPDIDKMLMPIFPYFSSNRENRYISHVHGEFTTVEFNNGSIMNAFQYYLYRNGVGNISKLKINSDIDKLSLLESMSKIDEEESINYNLIYWEIKKKLCLNKKYFTDVFKKSNIVINPMMYTYELYYKLKNSTNQRLFIGSISLDEDLKNIIIDHLVKVYRVKREDNMLFLY